ncbi:hypothetical protein FOA52_002481 [Chlamydomonas sp. UWO 241]|nr:hypothetical protein FOA52_002481 [Chlamydomonas sp. UWO 241]
MGSSQTVHVHGRNVPADWLIQSHDPKRFPASTLTSPAQQRQANRDMGWARTRDLWIAGAAAGLHVALFSFNLAFHGLEGTPPDRYNPTNIRQKLGVRPGRIGNMDGTKRIYYDNLARLEGVD